MNGVIAILKPALKRSGLTMSALSDKTGINYTALSEMFNGRRTVSARSAVLIGDVLGIDPTVLMDVQRDAELEEARMQLSGTFLSEPSSGYGQSRSRTVFNPCQQYLLELFARDGSEERLNELRQLLDGYYKSRLDAELTRMENSGEITPEKIDSWDHAHFRRRAKDGKDSL